jgi:uncharacterized membrane protein
MVPLIVLIVVTAAARVAGAAGVAPVRSWPGATRVGLAAMFCLTAAAHFNSMRTDLVRMVPLWVPNPELMVSFTGLCEICGAVGLLIPATRRVAAVALIALLLAVLPANVHAAQTGITLRGAAVTPLGPRILLQVLFIALVWWCGGRADAVEAPPRRAGPGANTGRT